MEQFIEAASESSPCLFAESLVHVTPLSRAGRLLHSSLVQLVEFGTVDPVFAEQAAQLDRRIMSREVGQIALQNHIMLDQIHSGVVGSLPKGPTARNTPFDKA